MGTGGIVINQIGKACALITVTLLYYLQLILLPQAVDKHINKLRPKDCKTRQCNGNGWGDAATGRGAEKGLWDRWHFNSALNEKGLALGRSGGRAFLEEGTARIKTSRISVRAPTKERWPLWFMSDG